MPLPSGGPWPPKELDPVTSRLAVWSAWYTGDTDQLSDIYGGNLAGDPGTPLTGYLNPDRPGLRGAIGRTLARWFWGIQTPQGEKRTKLHLPVAGDICTVSADLLFSEPPTFTLPEGATKGAADLTKAQDRINELCGDEMHATLLEAAEVAAGLGGVYLRVCWDKEVVPDQPWISTVHADSAVPEFRYGHLRAVTFWRHVHEDGGKVVRHLERHEPGVILHGLYDGGRGDLGKAIPLDAYPAAAGLPPVIQTGIPMLTADYIPNMRPAKVWRQQPAGAYLGRSDFSGAEGFMDSLDEVYSSWMRDLRHAKARLIVDENMLINLGQGQGSYFDPDREVYDGLRMPPGSNTPGITPIQFKIRVEEHERMAQHWLDKIVRTAGYSAQTFGENGDVAATTATEIEAREKRSFVTRKKKVTYTRPVLARITEALMAVDAVHFGSDVEPVRPDVKFGPAATEDMGSLAQTAQLLRAAESASTKTLVQLVHPDWKDEQVDAEVAAIQAEQQATSVPDPYGGMGAGGSGAPLDLSQDPTADPAAYGG